MLYKKTHTSKVAFNDHLKKIKKRGIDYKVNGMTIEYGVFKDKKDTTIKSRTVTDLIIEAAKKGYKKVKVVFKKVKLSDFPKSAQNDKLVKSMAGTQKTETFDVVDEALDIVSLLKSKDVEKIYFV